MKNYRKNIHILDTHANHLGKCVEKDDKEGADIHYNFLDGYLKALLHNKIITYKEWKKLSDEIYYIKHG